MTQVHRFSLIYDPAEDRLAWDSVDVEGGVARLWLTQRICRGLVGALLPMLQAATPATVPPEHQAAVQSWEQAAAMADFGKAPGVQLQPQSVVGLVRAVHIRPHDGRLELAFEFGEGQTRAVEVTHSAVRQMLSVMHRLSAAAGWPLDVWPAWIADPAAAAPGGALN
jgi:hypothetical protein